MSAEEMLTLATSFGMDLGPELNDSLSSSLIMAESRASGFPHSTYPFIRPLLVRCQLREELCSRQLAQGWTVTGNPQRMGQLQLSQDQVTVRVLKERRKQYPGGTPPAGRNDARRLYWQPSLDLPQDSVAQVPETRFLLLWDYVEPGTPNLSFTMRLVHTTAPGHYGSSVPLDLDLNLTGLDPAALKIPEFKTGAYEDYEDFYAEIDRDENGGIAEGGSLA